jgi:hypothetical protein
MRLGMRQYLSAIFWIVGTTAVVAGAQVVTTRAAAERRAVTRLNIALVENKVRIRELEAELRTRAGLPELQRWNDAVFQLSAAQTGQILQSPVQLASFAARPEPEAPAAPSVRYAIIEEGLSEMAPAPAAPTPPGGARLVTASFETGLDVPPAAPMPILAAPMVLPAPAGTAPAQPPAKPEDGEG